MLRHLYCIILGGGAPTVQQQLFPQSSGVSDCHLSFQDLDYLNSDKGKILLGFFRLFINSKL